MIEEELYEQVDFIENPLYEKVIEDLMDKKYSIVETFLTTGK